MNFREGWQVEVEKKIKELPEDGPRAVLLFMLGYMQHSEANGFVAFTEGLDSALIEYQDT